MALVATAESVGARLSLNGQEYCFTRIEDRSRFAFVDPNGEIICNTYDHHAERVAIGPRLIRLHVLMEPTPEEIDLLLPLIGYTEVTDAFTPKDTLTEFDAQVDYDGTDVGNYRSGKVDTAVLRGQQGLAPVSLELQMVFQDYDLDSAFSGTSVTLNAPYEFTAGNLGLSSTGGDNRLFNSSVWVHNNNLRARFNNNVTADNIVMTQRTMFLGVNTPFTSAEVDLLQEAVVDSTRLTGWEAFLTFTRGAQSLQGEFTNLKWEAKPAGVPRKDAEIRNMMYMKAYKEGADPVVTWTSTLS